MTPQEQIKSDARRRRLALAEADAGTRCVRVIHRGRCRSTLVGRDEAEVERLRHFVHEFHIAGKLGRRVEQTAV